MVAAQNKLDQMAKQYPSLGLQNEKVIKANNDMIATKNTKTGDVTVAVRGTDPSIKSDRANDWQIFKGQTPERTKAATDFARQVQKENPGSNIHLTGHSLGGTIASGVSKNTGIPATVFNPGTSPFNRQNTPDPKITNYHVQGDMISKYGVSGNEYTVPRQTYMPLGNHGLNNFLNLYQAGQLPGKLLLLLL